MVEFFNGERYLYTTIILIFLSYNILGAECKEKWRNIRSVFGRTLKTDRRKPYYLNAFMQFLVPFIKVYGTSNTKDYNASQNEALDSMHDTADWDFEIKEQCMKSDPEDNIEEVVIVVEDKSNLHHSFQNDQRDLSTPAQNRTDSSSSSFLDHLPYLPGTEPNKPSVEGDTDDRPSNSKIRKIEDLENNPKKMFLLSLLPDLNSMTDSQMRKFKFKVLELVDNILTNN